MPLALNMIGIVTNDLPAMRYFYENVLQLPVVFEADNFVEFTAPGIRFAISTQAVMHQATGDRSFIQPASGHTFELAFQADSVEAVDVEFQRIIQQGATPIKPPSSMPWGQRTAFFADPDGNVHEIFADEVKAE